MTTLIKRITPFIILLGVVLIAFGLHRIQGFTVVTQKSIVYGPDYTWTYFEIDFGKYLQNLETSISFDQFPEVFGITIPTLPVKPANNADVVGWLNFTAKLISVYLLNWIIFALNNLVLIPIKLLLYPTNVILAVLGINTSNNDFIVAFKGLYSLNIPLIPYW